MFLVVLVYESLCSNSRKDHLIDSLEQLRQKERNIVETIPLFISAYNLITCIFWLFLRDKLNTKDRLRMRHMEFEFYICENCILQKNETVYHLFLRCNFTRNCWDSIGVVLQ
jgi:hypothetical protein